VCSLLLSTGFEDDLDMYVFWNFTKFYPFNKTFLKFFDIYNKNRGTVQATQELFSYLQLHNMCCFSPMVSPECYFHLDQPMQLKRSHIQCSNPNNDCLPFQIQNYFLKCYPFTKKLSLSNWPSPPANRGPLGPHDSFWI
jgi:hypothetical protein